MISKRSCLITAMCVAMVAPTPVAAQDTRDLEFHALFPGQQVDGALDCSTGEAVYAPLRAGQTLQLADDTGVVVASGTLQDVVPPSRDGMCETSVTFVGVADAAEYVVQAGGQAISSRSRADLQASGWVARSVFGSRPQPTPAPTPAREPAANTGPVVLGGRIEIPAAGFALEVPRGWYAFDLTAPDLQAEMRSFDRTAARLAPNIDGLRLENLSPDIVAAEPRVQAPLWALAPLDGPTAGESCTVMVEPFDLDSLEAYAAALEVGAQEEMDQPVDLEPEYVDLPAGRAVMIEQSGRSPVGFEVEMTAFSLLHEDWGYTLQCGGLARQADRWRSIAETFEFLPKAE